MNDISRLRSVNNGNTTILHEKKNRTHVKYKPEKHYSQPSWNVSETNPKKKTRNTQRYNPLLHLCKDISRDYYSFIFTKVELGSNSLSSVPVAWHTNQIFISEIVNVNILKFVFVVCGINFRFTIISFFLLQLQEMSFTLWDNTYQSL